MNTKIFRSITVGRKLKPSYAYQKAKKIANGLGGIVADHKGFIYREGIVLFTPAQKDCLPIQETIAYS